MVNGEYVDIREELWKIVPDTFKQGIEESLYNEDINSNAKTLLFLCKNFTSKINTIIKSWNNYYQTYIYNVKGIKDKDDLDEDLMIYGTQLIYTLRKFLTDEEIVFHIASTDSKGKYQANAYISQSEILRNLSRVKAKAIGVSEKIERDLVLRNKEQSINKIFERKWKQIEYLSEVKTYVKSKNNNKIDMRKNGDKEAHWAYQNQKKDILIYIKFSKNKYTKYYDIGENGKKDDLISFNNGWLWEWYDNIYNTKDPQTLTTVHNGLNRGTLKPIFDLSEKDYTPGTKQGDWRNMIQGMEVQNKYNNSKIISYNNILHVMYDLIPVLEAYVNESQDKNITQNLLNVLQEHFFSDSIEVGQNILNEEFNQSILTKLNKKVNIKLKY